MWHDGFGFCYSKDNSVHEQHIGNDIIYLLYYATYQWLYLFLYFDCFIHTKYFL